MQALQKYHIIDIFVLVDDTLKLAAQQGFIPVKSAGRPSLLSDSELVTILLWDSLTEGHKTLRAVYSWVKREYLDYFPKLPNYQNFVAQSHRNLDKLIYLLQLTLQNFSLNAPIRFADSTMLPVCKLIRADRHKVARSVADFGKNWQGWHYGFKLHAAIDHNNNLVAIVFTPASQHDAQEMMKLVDEYTKILVGDSHYGAKVMGRKLYQKYGIITIAPPHYKQKSKLATKWQIFLLHMRPKIEATFDYLKEHMQIVTSFPRSVEGYFLHYVRILLGYQVRG
jgi:hypothetical protein